MAAQPVDTTHESTTGSTEADVLAFSEPAELDWGRRQALRELISLLTAVVAEAQVLTTAALRFDSGSMAAAAARLAEMGSDPLFDLTRTNDVYRALRQMIATRQPGRFASCLAGSPVETQPRVETTSSEPPAPAEAIRRPAERGQRP